ncbi:hypothetical protein GCM10028821_05140 [Hymenobacter jeollabukensis]
MSVPGFSPPVAPSTFLAAPPELPAGQGRYRLRWLTDAAAPPLPLAAELYLYQQPAQLRAAVPPLAVALLEDQHAAQTVAWWPIFRQPDGLAGSSPAAPFSYPQLLTAELPAPVLEEWLRAVHETLAAQGCLAWQLRLPPFAYEPTSGALVAALERLGYWVELAEIDTYLPLDQPYEARLHPSERRRLHKCQRHGFRFEQEPPLLLPLAYEFLRRCREEKGQALSLSEAQLTALFRDFPRDYLLFSVRDAAGDWAALTVAVLAGRGVLYNFYPASPLRYNAFSPVVLLNAGLHAFGLASGLRLLDLGTSTLPEGQNESLLRFKRHLGGVPSLKLTLTRRG